LPKTTWRLYELAAGLRAEAKKMESRLIPAFFLLFSMQLQMGNIQETHEKDRFRDNIQ
jgi:hypothetical protein